MKASSMRKGSVIMYNNAPYRVMECSHHTPGNLRAKVQVKMRNLLNSAQTEVRFNATEDIEEADVFLKKATYTYGDNAGYHFMDAETYEETTISADAIGDAVYYLQDNMAVQITTYNGDPIGIELPSTVTLTVADCPPEIKGATASNSPKPAKTDTGLQLNVPPFIKMGERIIVNTQDGSYVGRASD